MAQVNITTDVGTPPASQGAAPKPVVDIGPSATNGLPYDVNKVLSSIDPATTPINTRLLGFPDLPKYARELGAGITEGATAGLLKAPKDPETTPQVLLRGIGHAIGAGAPAAGGARLAVALGRSAVVGGALGQMAATEVETGGDASLGRLMLEGGLGALYGKFYKGRLADIPIADPSMVFKEKGVPALVKTPFIESEVSKTLRMAQESLTRKPKESLLPDYTTIGQIAKRHPDPDVRKQFKAYKTFWDNLPEGEIDPHHIDETLGKIRDGIEVKPGAVDFGLGVDITGDSEIPLSRRKTGIWWWSNKRPAKDVFMDVDYNAKTTTFNDLFTPATNARHAASNEIISVGKGIAEELRGSSSQKLMGMLDYLTTGEDTAARGAVIAKAGLSAEDIGKAQRVRDTLGKLWERSYGSSFDSYLTDTLPRLRNATPAKLDAIRNDDAADAILKFAANSEVRVHETNLAKFSASYLRSLALDYHFGPAEKQVWTAINSKKYPQELNKYMNDWIRGLRGTDSTFAERFNPSYRQFLARFGVNAQDADIRNVLHSYMQLTQAGLVGFRPAPLVRNMFNPWQTGAPIVGPTWLWRGYKEALGAEGIARSRAMGLFEEASTVAGDLSSIGASTRLSRFSSRVSEIGLRPYGAADELNRSVVANAMYLRVKDAARRLGKDGSQQFINESNLVRLHPTIRNQVIDTLRTKGIEAAAKLAGLHASQASQYVYRAGFRPTVMNGDVQKAMYQFGVWPLNYIENVKQMMTLPGVSGKERAKWFADFALTNGSLLALFGSAGAAAGLGTAGISHTLGWTFAGPLMYGGGPLVDTFFSIPKMMQSLNQGKFADAQRQVEQQMGSLASTVIPGSGLAKDIARARGVGAEALGATGLPGLDYSKSQAPSTDIGQEMFRIATGIGRKR